jgi:hypothetical protein
MAREPWGDALKHLDARAKRPVVRRLAAGIDEPFPGAFGAGKI